MVHGIINITTLEELKALRILAMAPGDEGVSASIFCDSSFEEIGRDSTSITTRLWKGVLAARTFKGKIILRVKDGDDGFEIYPASNHWELTVIKETAASSTR